jgi:transposase
MTGYFLSVEEQSFIAGMNTSGASLSEIANVVRKSKKSISLVLKRYRERGSIQIAKRSGRPKSCKRLIDKFSNMRLSRIVEYLMLNLLVACPFL